MTALCTPSAWMSLDGHRQGRADRNTRGYFSPTGERVWLNVFPSLWWRLIVRPVRSL
jgi:hypothetical protein